MKKQPGYFLVLLAVVGLLFTACKNSSDYKRTKSGVMYKIFSDGKDSAAKTGNIVKIEYTIRVGSSDSVLRTTVGNMPEFVAVQDVPAEAYSPLEVFSMLRKGDSAEIVQLIDTVMKKGQGGQRPPFFKKGDKVLTIVKVLDIFKTPELATKDREAEVAKAKVRAEQQSTVDLVKGSEDMAVWLASKKITATKVGKGTYVVVKEPGTGMLADSGKYATVRYEGKTLDGKVFQSTMDPKASPYTLQVGTGGAVRGWDEGIPLFRKGGKGTLYIPGALAYGRNPPQGSPFKPNEALVFDIEVVNVSDSAPAPQQQAIPPQVLEQMKKQQQQQQQKPAH